MPNSTTPLPPEAAEAAAKAAGTLESSGLEGTYGTPPATTSPSPAVSATATVAPAAAVAVSPEPAAQQQQQQQPEQPQPGKGPQIQ